MTKLLRVRKKGKITYDVNALLNLLSIFSKEYGLDVEELSAHEQVMQLIGKLSNTKRLRKEGHWWWPVETQGQHLRSLLCVISDMDAYEVIWDSNKTA